MLTYRQGTKGTGAAANDVIKPAPLVSPQEFVSITVPGDYPIGAGAQKELVVEHPRN